MSRKPAQDWRAKLPESETLALGSASSLRRAGAADFRPLGTPARGAFYVGEGGALGLLVVVTIDQTPHGRLLHCSLSYADRDPTWAEIKAVRAAFFPDGLDAAMLLPRAADYVNLHPFCFHLWQLPVAWGLR